MTLTVKNILAVFVLMASTGSLFCWACEPKSMASRPTVHWQSFWMEFFLVWLLADLALSALASWVFARGGKGHTP